MKMKNTKPEMSSSIFIDSLWKGDKPLLFPFISPPFFGHIILKEVGKKCAFSKSPIYFDPI